MSFAGEVKQEIAQNELKDCCKRAELSALIQLCSTLSISNGGLTLRIKTEHATVAKRVWKMIKEVYEVECQLSVLRKMKLKKNNVYIIRIMNKAKEILTDLGLFSSKGLLEHPMAAIVSKECCARAYLAGAFMAMGSVNSPSTTNYHLEIATNNEAHAAYIQKIMQRFGLPSKVIQRRQQCVVYCKQADKIGDFLRCIGAGDSLMKFEDIRIHRDFKNSLTRLDNCEVANEMKSQKAAKGQLEDIAVLRENKAFLQLDSRLKEVVELREQYPEASLLELSKLYEIKTGTVMSKSGMKHRFTKIHELALQYKKD